MYEKKISRANPGLVVFLLDDSGSMADNLPGTTDPKWQWNERLFGVTTHDLLSRCNDLHGKDLRIKDRYYTYNVIYGSHPEAWEGGLMDVKTTIERFTSSGNSLGLGGKMGGTHTEAGFQEVYNALVKLIQDERFKNSFPPIVFHLTDGMSHTDASPIAEMIKQLSTSDGNVLIANAYIGTETDLQYNGPEDFPGYVDVSDVGSNSDNLRMFNMSSVVPEAVRQNLIEDGIFPNFREGARLFFDVRTKDMLKRCIQVVSSQGSRADRSVK